MCLLLPDISGSLSIALGDGAIISISLVRFSIWVSIKKYNTIIEIDVRQY